MRSINIDQTLRPDVASYELCCAYRYDDAVIACDDIITYGYNSARHNSALLETAIFDSGYYNQLAQEEANEFSQSYRWIGSGGKRVFRELSRGCAVFITPGHRATTGAPS